MSTKRNRIMELAGLSHRSRLLVEEEGEDLFGDDENKDDADKEDVNFRIFIVAESTSINQEKCENLHFWRTSGHAR